MPGAGYRHRPPGLSGGVDAMRRYWPDFLRRHEIRLAPITAGADSARARYLLSGLSPPRRFVSPKSTNLPGGRGGAAVRRYPATQRVALAKVIYFLFFICATAPSNVLNRRVKCSWISVPFGSQKVANKALRTLINKKSNNYVAVQKWGSYPGCGAVGQIRGRLPGFKRD